MVPVTAPRRHKGAWEQMLAGLRVELCFVLHLVQLKDLSEGAFKQDFARHQAFTTSAFQQFRMVKIRPRACVAPRAQYELLQTA